MSTVAQLTDAIGDFESTIEEQEQYIERLKRIAVLAVSLLEDATGETLETIDLREQLESLNIEV